jgi:outer membrane protein TolC
MRPIVLQRGGPAGDAGRICSPSPVLCRTDYKSIPRALTLRPGLCRIVAATLILIGCSSATAGDPFAADRTVVPAAVLAAPTPISPITDSQTETIDLGVALRLAGVDNPTINLARERVEEAAADELAARFLWLPSITIGGNYHNHHGALETSFGYIRRVDSQSVYAGLGARALAAESVGQPGIRLFAHLGDAIYEPLAARQRVAARSADVDAMRNTTLLAVATAYLQFAQAEAEIEALRHAETDLAEVVRLAREYAAAGQGRKGEANRALARSALLIREAQLPQEQAASAAAELARLLNLDPAVRLRTPAGSLVPVRLVPEDTPLDALVATALRTRPEVYARSAEVLEARAHFRQEQVRPFVPTVSAGYSYGWFGGGSNLVSPEFGPMKGRSDFDVYAVWTFDNLGFGNRARTAGADARVGQAIARLQVDVNRVRREVAEAQADAAAAARQLEIVRPTVRTAEEGFELEKLRIHEGQGRPIELLDSFSQLVDARVELLRVIAAFNTSQFRLFVGMGSDPLGGPIP